VHAAFDRLRSYARGRTERLSTMARQIIEDDQRADLLTAPALGRTTAQKRSPRTASGTNQPDAALHLERPRTPTIGPRPGGRTSAGRDQRRRLRRSHSHLRASNSRIFFTMTVLPTR
jgi:hypothetical protein